MKRMHENRQRGARQKEAVEKTESDPKKKMTGQGS